MECAAAAVPWPSVPFSKETEKGNRHGPPSCVTCSGIVLHQERAQLTKQLQHALGAAGRHLARRARGLAFGRSRAQLQHVLGALAVGRRLGGHGLSRATGHGAARYRRGARGLGRETLQVGVGVGWVRARGKAPHVSVGMGVGKGIWAALAASAECRRAVRVAGVGVVGVGGRGVGAGGVGAGGGCPGRKPKKPEKGRR